MDITYRRCRYFSHAYFALSLLGAATFFCHVIAPFFVTLFGATSPYYAFIFFLFSEKPPLVPVSAIFSLLFYLALIVSYILALRKHYLFMAILVALDALLIGFLYSCTLFTDGFMASGILLPELAVSILSAVFFLHEVSVILYHKRRYPNL